MYNLIEIDKRKQIRFGFFRCAFIFLINKKPANGANTFYGVQHVPFMLSFRFSTQKMIGVSLSTNRELHQ